MFVFFLIVVLTVLERDIFGAETHVQTKSERK